MVDQDAGDLSSSMSGAATRFCREQSSDNRVECERSDVEQVFPERLEWTDQDSPLSPAQVHELRNRLYAASLAFRAICVMLDKGRIEAARAAAETMLGTLGHELEDSRESDFSESNTSRVSTGTQVLLVEDDDMESQLLCDYLTEHGYAVTRARDGLEALTKLKQTVLPHVVLLDMNMPRLDGPKTITSIRADERLTNLRVIAISGADTSTIELQKARRSVDFWITKPADPRRVVGAIRELAKR